MKVATNTAKILRNIPLPDEVAVTHNNAVILDMGSYSTRIGFSGDNAPRMNERTVAIKGEMDENQRSTGGLCFDKAYDSRGDNSDIVNVMENGLITDWDACEQLFHHIDDMLLLSNTDMNNPLMLTEKALVPHEHRQKLAEMLFEQFNLQSMFFVLSPVASLYASGLCTGVSVELGHCQCHVAPVFQGFAHFHAIHCLPIGGRDMTALLQQRSTAQLPSSVLPRSEADTWVFLKESCGYTLENRSAFSTAMQNASGEKYMMSHRLPDGSVVTLGAERFIPSEALFQPMSFFPEPKDADQSHFESEVLLRSFAGPMRGIHELLVDSVKKCDHDLAPMFLDNILLSGGGSLFGGFPDRLESEVQALLPVRADRVRVVAEVERRGAPFVGASILASLPSFQPLWVTKKDYEEFGSIAVVRGCFNA